MNSHFCFACLCVCVCVWESAKWRICTCQRHDSMCVCERECVCAYTCQFERIHSPVTSSFCLFVSRHWEGSSEKPRQHAHTHTQTHTHTHTVISAMGRCWDHWLLKRISPMAVWMCATYLHLWVMNALPLPVSHGCVYVRERKRQGTEKHGGGRLTHKKESLRGRNIFAGCGALYLSHFRVLQFLSLTPEFFWDITGRALSEWQQW